MELLDEPTFKDRVHYAVAFLLTAVCGALGLWAAHQIRVVILLAATVVESRRRGFRVADRFGWVVLGILWLAYAMAVEHSHRTGVTEARVRRARHQEPDRKYENRAVLRWLRKHDLHIAVERFLRNALIPIGILIVAILVSELLGALATG